MNRLYYIFLVVIAVCGCYDDKGNYDYKELDVLSIGLPEEAYSLLFGEKLQITPTIETGIPEDDLAYEWEFYGKDSTSWWSVYIPVYEGKTLDYTCLHDEKLLNKEGTYQLRLNVTQISTGRHFYSDVIPVQLSFQLSHLGAMVLHGDGTVSDIGLVVAEDFQMVEPSKPLSTEVYPHYYSDANQGSKIAGRGQWIMQTCSKSAYKYPDNLVIIAVTDESSALAHSKSLLKTGEWNDLFYGGINKGEPGACFINSMTLFIIDGGDVYTKLYTDIKFTVPLFTAADWEYDFYPQVLLLPKSNPLKAGALVFDRAKRGFVAVMGVLNNFNKFSPLDADAGNEGISIPFNPADMEANLVHMDLGGAGNHVLAVMRKGDGDCFMIELDISASGFSGAPKYKYDLIHLDDVRNNRVVDWAFGSTYMNMCYYATPDGVYRFSADAGKTVQPEPLMMADNSEVRFEGTVTMMKILKPDIFAPESNSTYYKSNREMVVGTYGGIPGSGILYSIELDPFSGRVQSVREYTGFDEIYDVNIKGY